MPTTLRSTREVFELNTELLAQSWLGQDPLVGHPNAAGRITSVYVPGPFGRFGNNFYQIANAVIVADRLDAPEVQLPPFQLSPACHTVPTGAILLTNRQADQAGRATLSGHFYAPFGLEALFADMPTARMVEIVRPIARTYYKELIDKAAAEKRRTIAAHFRGGDIYDVSIPAHPWYVQPPAAFYIFAIAHARRSNAYDEVRLVIEDLSNPAIAEVRRFLEDENIPHAIEQRSLEEDVVSLLSATCIVASSSTLPEATAIMSDHLRSVYGFRTLASQTDFRPFFQSRVEAAINCLGVKGFIVDDSSCMYTPQKSWSNSAAQRERVIDFPVGNLRIYDTGYDNVRGHSG